MGRFFKIWPNLSQNWLKFKRILEKICHFVQNLAQNLADWCMNGLLFLEKLVFVWVYLQIPWRHIPTKTKLEYPPGIRPTRWWWLWCGEQYSVPLPPPLATSYGI